MQKYRSYSLASLKAAVISLINRIEISFENWNASKLFVTNNNHTNKNPSSFSNNFESKTKRDLRTKRGFSTIKANCNRWVSVHWKLKPPRPIRFHFRLTQLRLASFQSNLIENYILLWIFGSFSSFVTTTHLQWLIRCDRKLMTTFRILCRFSSKKYFQFGAKKT